MYTLQQSHPPWTNDSSQPSTLHQNTPPNSKLDRKRQAQQWIEKILGYHLPTDDLQYDLQDGVLLCQLVLGFGHFYSIKLAILLLFSDLTAVTNMTEF
jgi:hypothetical protein